MTDKKWAIIEVGGHQHLVTAGARVVTNRLTNKEGEAIKLNDLLSSEPVEVKVVSHNLGKKVSGLKFKNKIRYIKRYGHRQTQTLLEVVTIGQKEQAKAEAPKAAAKAPKKAAAKKEADK